MKLEKVAGVIFLSFIGDFEVTHNILEKELFLWAIFPFLWSLKEKRIYTYIFQSPTLEVIHLSLTSHKWNPLEQENNIYRLTGEKQLVLKLRANGGKGSNWFSLLSCLIWVYGFIYVVDVIAWNRKQVFTFFGNNFSWLKKLLTHFWLRYTISVI